jgi:hypothetical protein
MQDGTIEDTGYKHLWQKFVHISVGLGVATIVAIPAGLYFLYRASSETRRAAQASLLSQLHSEYASPEMTAAMRELNRWKEDHPTDFAERFVALYKRRDPKGDELDNYRRLAYRFFEKIRRLMISGLIDPKLIHLVTFARVGGRFLIGVIEPMQKVHGRLITNRGIGNCLTITARKLQKTTRFRANGVTIPRD